MNRPIVLASAAALLISSVVSGRADTLADIVHGAEKAVRVTAPLRADVTAEIDNLKGTTQDRVVIIERTPEGGKVDQQVSAQFERAKVRVLALGPGDLYLATEGKAKTVTADAPVDSTSWTAEDFLPFSAARCAAMRIADLAADQVTLVCEPDRKVSQYSLMVYKLDRERFTVRQVLLYKDSMTNLVKMLRNDDFEEIGTAWRPKRVVMQDFKLRTKDRFDVRWQTAAAVPPEVFDPKAFAGAPPLPAPAKP